MRQKKCMKNLRVLILMCLFFVFSGSIFSLPPKTCPQCWSKLKNNLGQLSLDVKKIWNNRYKINLSPLRAALEKSGVGEQVKVQLQFRNGKTVTLGCWSSVEKPKGEKVRNACPEMREASFHLPAGVLKIDQRIIIFVQAAPGGFSIANEVAISKGLPGGKSGSKFDLYPNLESSKAMDEISSIEMLQWSESLNDGARLVGSLVNIRRSGFEEKKKNQELKKAAMKLKLAAEDEALHRKGNSPSKKKAFIKLLFSLKRFNKTLRQVKDRPPNRSALLKYRQLFKELKMLFN